MLRRMQQSDESGDAPSVCDEWDREQAAGMSPMAPPVESYSFSVETTPVASRSSSRSTSRPLLPGPRTMAAAPSPHSSPHAGPGGGAAAQATMLASLMVLIYEAIAFNVVYLGRILPLVGKDFLVLPYMIVFNSVWGLAVWSYFVAHASDPGVVPKQWHEFVSKVSDGLLVVPARLEWQPGKATLCRKCGTPRPERAHHCHICGICILRMDHHCPWIKNCVGFKNHKFFLLLVVYCCLSAFVGLVMSMPELVYCTRVLLHLEDTMLGQPVIEVSDMMVFMIFELLALFFIALLLPMVITHVPLAASNVTSIESHYDDIIANPFDRGGTINNLAEVFGDFGLDWCFPVYPHRPVSDGVSFARNAADSVRWEDLLGSSGGDTIVATEALWRERYNVQFKLANRPSGDGSYGPLSAFARWANGSVDAINPSVNFKCQKPPAGEIM